MAGRFATFDRFGRRHFGSAFWGDPPSVRALVITCVDGCFPAGSLESQLQMDGVAVMRNPANLVPCRQDEGLAETIAQALTRGASELVVCGHAGCAMIARLLNPRTALEDLELAAWLEHAEAVRLATGVVPPDDRLARAVEWNVTQQLVHLRAYPAVAAALLGGRVGLRGWMVDPAREEVLAADPRTGRFTRRAALDPAQNRLFRPERLRAGQPPSLPFRDLRSRYLA